VAACDLNDLGEAIEKTRTRWTLTRTGITVDHDTKINARLMLLSCVSFFVVQIVAFWYLAKDEQIAGSKAEVVRENKTKELCKCFVSFFSILSRLPGSRCARRCLWRTACISF
jgi:hypothetical protein